MKKVAETKSRVEGSFTRRPHDVEGTTSWCRRRLSYPAKKACEKTLDIKRERENTPIARIRMDNPNPFSFSEPPKAYFISRQGAGVGEGPLLVTPPRP